MCARPGHEPFYGANTDVDLAREWIDNMSVEELRRTFKYERVHLDAFCDAG
jgi:hypothetical protein